MPSAVPTSYLGTSNRDNGTLIDTVDTHGVERITETSAVAGTAYEVDRIIFATGFQVGVPGILSGRLPVYGRGGIHLFEAWSKGPKTLHGFYRHGFPKPLPTRAAAERQLRPCSRRTGHPRRRGRHRAPQAPGAVCRADPRGPARLAGHPPKNALDLHKFPQVRLVRQPAAQKRPLAARTADATPPAVGSNGIAFGPDRRLYVAELLAGRISAVDPATGDLEVIVPMDSPVQSPDDLAFRADSSMYIADLVPGRAWRCSPEGIRWSPTRCRCPTALPASGTGSSPTR